MLTFILICALGQLNEKAFNVFEPQIPLYSQTVIDEALWTKKPVYVGKNIPIEKLNQFGQGIICVSNHKDFPDGISELVVVNGKLCFKPSEKPKAGYHYECGPNGCQLVPNETVQFGVRTFSSCSSCGR